MGNKNTLYAWALFLPGGVRLINTHEYTPPAMSISKTTFKTGAMDAPVSLDDGMEELTCSFKIYGYSTEILSLYGMTTSVTSPIVTARQVYRDGRGFTGQVETLQGMITSITQDARPNTSKSDAALQVEMSLEYYQSVYNGVERICIIPDEFVRRINGVNVLEAAKTLLRV
ncbi:TPA: phage major tail tube protein [Klebsiella pneumoniae]